MHHHFERLEGHRRGTVRDSAAQDGPMIFGKAAVRPGNSWGLLQPALFSWPAAPSMKSSIAARRGLVARQPSAGTFSLTLRHFREFCDCESFGPILGPK